MKIWSVILGVAALALSLFLAVNWPLSVAGAKKAAKDETGFIAHARNAEFAEELAQATDEQNLRTDRLRLRNAELDENIARLQGRSIGPALKEQARIESMIRADERVVELNQMAPPSDAPAVTDARARAAAAEASRAVYAHSWVRDEHLAYVAGVLWLAFGFAIALRHR